MITTIHRRIIPAEIAVGEIPPLITPAEMEIAMEEIPPLIIPAEKRRRMKPTAEKAEMRPLKQSEYLCRRNTGRQ